MHMNTFKLKLNFLVTKRIETYVLQISDHKKVNINTKSLKKVNFSAQEVFWEIYQLRNCNRKLLDYKS